MILHDFRHDARQLHFKHTNFWNGCTCNASLFRKQRLILETSKQLNENLYFCYTVVEIDGKWVSFLVEIDFSLCYSLFLFLSLLPMFYFKKIEIGLALCLCNHFFFLKKAKKKQEKISVILCSTSSFSIDWWWARDGKSLHHFFRMRNDFTIHSICVGRGVSFSNRSTFGCNWVILRRTMIGYLFHWKLSYKQQFIMEPTQKREKKSY